MHNSVATPPSHIISQEQAADLLQPILEDLSACVQAGMDRLARFKAKNPEDYLSMQSRTKSCIRFEGIVQEAVKRFSGRSDITVCQSNNTLILNVKGLIAARFKKLNKKGLPSNIKTKRQEKIDLQLPMEGMQETTYVTVGFKLDPLEQEISLRKVDCMFNGESVWSLSMTGKPIEKEVAIPVAPPKKSTRTKIKAKPGMMPKKQKNE